MEEHKQIPQSAMLLILSPAMLQRYNRLRVYAAIQRLAAREAQGGS